MLIDSAHQNFSANRNSFTFGYSQNICSKVFILSDKNKIILHSILCKYRLLINGKVREYSLLGRVLAVRELENRKGIYEHRVQYVNMDSEDREEIIKYIFDEERKTLKNQKN